MNEVTTQQVKEAFKAAGRSRWTFRNCSICGYPCAYVTDGERVAYDAGCDCTSRNNYEPRTWDDIARTLNRQTPEVRARMWREITTKAPPA